MNTFQNGQSGLKRARVHLLTPANLMVHGATGGSNKLAELTVQNSEYEFHLLQEQHENEATKTKHATQIKIQHAIKKIFSLKNWPKGHSFNFKLRIVNITKQLGNKLSLT